MLPVLLLLFLGCLQLLQIAVAQLVVMDAAYEAGRQAYLHAGQTEPGQAAAADICRSLSPGRTDFGYDPDAGAYRVTHHLQPLFPRVGKPAISYACPASVFSAGDHGGQDEAP